MNTLRRFMAACLTLALAATVHAQGTSLGWGQRVVQTTSGTNPQGQLKIGIVGGINPVDSTAVPFQFDGSGRQVTVDGDRDRDYSQLINLGVSGVQLTAGKTVVPLTARYIGQFSRGSILMSYTKATAADSDSVVLAVYIYGMYSPAGTQHLWTPWIPSQTIATADTCYDNSSPTDSTAGVGHCLRTRPSYIVYRAQQGTNWPTMFATTEGAGIRQSIRKLPVWALRYGGKNGIMLGLTDNAGGVFPYPYILVIVQNLMCATTASSSTITGLEVNFWPRVW